MGVSLNWLREYVDFDWEPQELAHRLTMAGIAIEGIETIDGDTIMKLDLTPNRGDCLGLINLAREVAALNGNRVNIPVPFIQESHDNIADHIKVGIAAPDLCKRYAARVIRNCRVMPSPGWMQTALLNSGIRPINNIVDVTNYVMLETNQPLHAFDYNLLGEGQEILVRTAGSGEKITTLDGTERELDENMLLITDGVRPVALAGIMGGENTEINESTTTVLLESACFLGTNIRKTSRKLSLRSDSSQRFEKGSDINGVIYAVNRAAGLLQDIAAGEVVGAVYDEYPQKQEDIKITLRPEQTNLLLDTRLTVQEIKQYLDKLGFTVTEVEDGLLVNVPSYRPDIEVEVDLIEEVARLYGYENIPSKLIYGDTTRGGLTKYQKFRDDVKNIMSQNLCEVINYSFICETAFDRLLFPTDSNLRQVVRIANPLSEEQSVMRTTLIPGLLDNIYRNLSRKNRNPAFYEMGSVFYPQETGLPVEEMKLAAIVCGNSEVNWLKHKLEMDFFFIKGILEELLRRLGIKRYAFQPVENPGYHPGRTARLLVAGEEIGVVGEVHPRVLDNYDIKARTCAFELSIEKLFALSGKRNMMQEITRYPAADRDIAILVDQEVQAAQVSAAIEAAEQELLREVIVFDLYTGGQVPPGKKSMAFRLVLQSSERTLTEADLNACIANIIGYLQNKCGASLR